MNMSQISKEYFKEFEEKDITRFFIDDNLQAIIATSNYEKGYRFKHVDKSDLLIVGFCLDGQMTIDHRGEKIINKGESFYFRPVEDFNIKAYDHSSLNYLIDLSYLKEHLCCKKFNNLYKEGILRIARTPYIMESYIEEIKRFKNIEKNNLFDYINIKSILLNNLNWALKLKSSNQAFIDEKKNDEYYIYRTKEIITDNLEGQITVKAIVEILGISVYKLQKIFKKSYSTTVYDFIRKVKIDNSKVFLSESCLSIIDISQKLGYENPSKFSTAFKDITGQTPTEYRKNINN